MANPDPSPSTRFKHGEPSANPAGRPPGRGIGAVLNDKLCEPGVDGQTPAERIADALIRLAVGGDVRAIALICDRVEGKPRQSIALENQGPAWIEVKYVDDWRPGVKGFATGNTPDDL